MFIADTDYVNHDVNYDTGRHVISALAAFLKR
jgi:hypothetical protein